MLSDHNIIHKPRIACRLARFASSRGRATPFSRSAPPAQKTIVRPQPTTIDSSPVTWASSRDRRSPFVQMCPPGGAPSRPPQEGHRYRRGSSGYVGPCPDPLYQMGMPILPRADRDPISTMHHEKGFPVANLPTRAGGSAISGMRPVGNQAGVSQSRAKLLLRSDFPFRGRAAMAALEIRTDIEVEALRRFARAEADGRVASRLRSRTRWRA